MMGWWGRFLFAGLVAGTGFSSADVSNYNATCVDETTTLLQTTVPRHEREVTSVTGSAHASTPTVYSGECTQNTCSDVPENYPNTAQCKPPRCSVARPDGTQFKSADGTVFIEIPHGYCTAGGAYTEQVNVLFSGPNCASDDYVCKHASDLPTKAMKICADLPHCLGFEVAYRDGTGGGDNIWVHGQWGDHYKSTFASSSEIPAWTSANYLEAIQNEWWAPDLTNYDMYIKAPVTTPAAATCLSSARITDWDSFSADGGGAWNCACTSPPDANCNVVSDNNNGNCYWDSGLGWLKVGSSEAKTVTAFSFRSTMGNLYQFEIQYSDDDATWTTAKTCDSSCVAPVQGNGYIHVDMDTAASANYWKFNIIQNPGNGLGHIYDFEFIGCSAASPTTVQAVGQVADASAAGDPHLVNLRGDKFDVNVAGEHLLLRIPHGSGEDLEVVGFVEQLPTQNSGQSPCDQFLFKKFVVRGNYVDSHKAEILINAGDNLALQGFAATHQHHGKTVSTSYQSLLKQNTPTTVGKVQIWSCKDNNPKEQKSLCKQLGAVAGAGHRQLKVFTRKASTFVMTLQGVGLSPLYLAFSRFEGASPSYLNLALHGLSPSDDVGGLLGNDDHHEVAKAVGGCTVTHHSKDRPAARQHKQDHLKQNERKRNLTTSAHHR